MCVPVYQQRIFYVCVYVKYFEAPWRDRLTVEFRDVGCTSLCNAHIVTAFCFPGNCLVSVRKRKHALKNECSIRVKYRK